MFDLSNVKANTGSMLPDGKYEVYLTDAALKDTKSGIGKYISVQFKIPSGDHANRVVFHNFNVVNANAQAVEIGLSQLKSLLECAGFATPDKLDNIDQLVGLRVGIKTRTAKDTGFGEKTEVSYFYKLSDAASSEKPADNIAF